MIYAALGFLIPFTLWSLRALRRRHHAAMLAAYCAGFNDGMASNAMAQTAEQGRRVVIRTLMNLN